jgi:3-oxoacyl-[acyl-carrier protein] reductase
MPRLQGLVSVVTGAGSGIGRESALEFAREGARVVVADLNEAAARDTVDQIERAGGEAEPVKVDVTSFEQVAAMLRVAQERFGRLDVLFNNAGIPQAFTPCEDTSDELFERIFDVNVKGVWNGCRAAISPSSSRRTKSASCRSARWRRTRRC